MKIKKAGYIILMVIVFTLTLFEGNKIFAIKYYCSFNNTQCNASVNALVYATDYCNGACVSLQGPFTSLSACDANSLCTY
jgi:hypothetical protein